MLPLIPSRTMKSVAFMGDEKDQDENRGRECEFSEIEGHIFLFADASATAVGQ